MGFFRNATVFEYTEEGAEVRPVDLEFAAASFRARAPEKHESSTMGFVPALWAGALELVHVSGRYAMAAVRIEQKRVPPSLWREDTSRRGGEFAVREGREPSREEWGALKAASWTDLLARAFPRARVVRVLFAPGMVIVGSASKNDVDDVCGLIRQALGSLKLRPVREPSATRTVLTHWVKAGAPREDNGIGFYLGEAATLKGGPVKGEGPAEVVTLRNAHLRGDEVFAHLEHRKDVLRLALGWRMSDEILVRFVVDSEFVVRSIKTEGSVADTGDAEDAASIYAAEFFAEAGVLERLVLALREYLTPGKAPAGAEARVAGEREVRIAADLYNARDEMRDLFGPLYAEKMADSGARLKAEAEKLGKDILATAIDVAKRQPSIVLQKMALAAAVELIEPTAEGQPS